MMRGVLSLFFCFILFNATVTRAQVCTGSLGDPIINIDFGSGSARYGPQLGAGITNYSYVAAGPNDGSYTITNSSAGYHDTWYTKTDHTGNTGGYMMLVNASNEPGVFYTQSITGLCPGTTYEFAAWILNLLIPNNNKPNITFKISTPAGVTLKTYDTGDIANGNSAWTQYGTLFTTPVGGGDIVLTMINNGPGGNGNDLALDDITFRACGPVITSSFIGSAQATITACAGSNQSYTMNASASSGFTVPAYQWQKLSTANVWQDIPGANTTSYTANFTPAVAGTYQYRLASAEAINIASSTCRVLSNVLTLTIDNPPASTVTGTTTLCQGDLLSLTASAGNTYSWTGPNNFTSTLQTISIPAAKVANAGTYKVVVTGAGNCSTSASINVTVNAKPSPTATGGANICEGNSVTLQATGGVGYSWSPAAGLSNPLIANPAASPSVTTKYTVTVTNAAGCTDTASTTVTVVQAPVVKAGDDQKMTEGQSIKLDGSITGTNFTYFWTPATNLSSSTVLNPVATPTEDITYTLHAIDGNGCGFEITDDVFIRVFKKVVVPNTFTPNNDAINDTWAIEALETYPESTTQVFNRYGIMVFQSKGYPKAWDGKQNGKPLPEGTYYYKIDLKTGVVLSGWLAILR
jgi:gliding motility-associated-like protein